MKILIALLFSTAAFANPLIHSVSPAAGPTTGGTQVTIVGAGFSPNADVFFGDTRATQTQFVNDTTLVAVSPSHLPGLTAVEIRQADGNQFKSFTFQGPVPPTFERVLLPTFTGPVDGAFGSRFETELRVTSRTTDRIGLYGLMLDCRVLCIWGDIDHPPTVALHEPIDNSRDVVNTGTPGHFLMVRTSDVGRLNANLRVYDATRTDANFGTEIPIVRQRDFIDPREPLEFLGVPTDPRFRNTLRVYSYDFGSPVVITVEGQESKIVQMSGGGTIFEPLYAVFTDFPTGPEPVKVRVELLQPNISADARQPYWAFITVTNNETQLISTISPQP